MATYYLTDIASDLSAGTEFNTTLTQTTQTAGEVQASVGLGLTEIGCAFTEATVPGNKGTTGDITVEANVTVANGSIQIAVQVHRVNSAGTVQASSATTAEQSAGALGILTFNLTNVNLGTWVSGDRFRVDYRFRNSAAHGGAQAVTLGTGTTNEEVITPFGVVKFGTPIVISNTGSTRIEFTIDPRTNQIELF